MPFVLRSNRRFSVSRYATNKDWFREGQGTVWDLPYDVLRRSINIPLKRRGCVLLNITLRTAFYILIVIGVLVWVDHL